MRVKSFAVAALLSIGLSGTTSAQPLQADLEQAAIIGAALLLCDISNGVGSHGWGHHIMLGADNLGVSHDAATELVESRTREIVTYLNREKKLDEFCVNARAESI